MKDGNGPFRGEMKRTQGLELLWAYAKDTLPKPGQDMELWDMLRAVCNAITTLGDTDLRHHPPEAIVRMVETLATVTHMIHAETNLLRRDHELAPLSVDDVVRMKKKV